MRAIVASGAISNIDRKAIIMRIISKKSSAGASDEDMRLILAECKKFSNKQLFKKPNNKNKIINKNKFKISNKLYVRKIWVLWRLLLKAGIVGAKTPNGYVRRMAGVDNIEWLEPDQGYKIIEGLKSWCDRENVSYDR